MAARSLLPSKNIGRASFRACGRSRRARLRITAYSQHSDGPHVAAVPADFALNMMALEAVLPTMSCRQLAKTGTSVRETYRAVLLSTEAGSSSTDTTTRDLLDFFTSQLPNQTWLLTYRSAVEQHLMPSAASVSAISPAPAGTGGAEASDDSSSSSSRATLPGEAGSCLPEYLAEILAAVAALPIQVVQPLPIGFGTPRWSRPMSAADPAAWEQWLTLLANKYCSAAAAAAVQGEEELADFTISLVCSMRWVNVNVDDDRLQTPEFRQKVVDCLRQQQQQQQQASSAGQPLQASAEQQQQQHQEEEGQPAPRQAEAVPLTLAGSLAHRLTYTCLLLLLPPPRPMLSALFAATQPTDFSLEELQRIVRGLLFVGCAPPEPWLQGLVVLVRSRLGQMGQQELLGFVEAFRFFGTQVGRAPWLRDCTALLEEFSCTA